MILLQSDAGLDLQCSGRPAVLLVALLGPSLHDSCQGLDRFPETNKKRLDGSQTKICREVTPYHLQECRPSFSLLDLLVLSSNVCPEFDGVEA